MAILDVGHPAFGCADLNVALEFYAKLGITESFRLLYEDGSIMLIYMQVGKGDRFIELFPNGPKAEDRATDANQSFRHICLKVDDLDGTVEELRAAGITIDVEPQMGLDFNKQAWITDPDGNRIELMQLSPESPQMAIVNGTTFPSSDTLVKPEA